MPQFKILENPTRQKKKDKQFKKKIGSLGGCELFSSLNREAHTWLIKKDKLKESESIKMTKYRLQSDSEAPMMIRSKKQNKYNEQGETIPTELSEDDDDFKN